MRTFIFIILAVFLFQVAFTQQIEDDKGIVPSQEISAESGADIFTKVERSLQLPIDIGNWNPIEPNGINTDPLKPKVLNFGEQWVISQLIGRSIIFTSSSWKIGKVNSYDAESLDGLTYNVNAQFTNDEEESFTANFSVNIGESHNEFQIKSASYLLNNGANLISIDPIEFETENASEDSLEAGWIQLELEEAQNDLTISLTPDEIADFAIQKGLNEGVLPTGNWSLVDLKQVSTPTMPELGYYLAVILTNGESMNAYGVVYAFQSEVNGPSSIITSGIWYVGPGRV